MTKENVIKIQSSKSLYLSRRFLIISGVLTAVGFFLQYFTSGFLSLLVAFFQIVLLSIFVASFRFLFSRKIPFRFLFLRYALLFGSIAGFFSALILLFAFYQNSFPGAVSKITLSDGDRTIVFIQMSHIATPAFYEKIHTDLVSLSHSGYTIYAEGVRPGTEENTEKFQNLLGIKLTANTYTKIADTIGMKSQGKDIFIGVSTGSIKNVDISIDDIMKIIGTGSIASQAPPLDMETELANLPDGKIAPLSQYIVRSVLNMMIKTDADTDTFLSGMIDPQLFDVILGKRNQYIADTFFQSDDKNVVFLYGSLHFSGIYKILQSQNPNWKIISMTPYYPYK